MELKYRKTLLVATILYTVLIMYFLFFAFNRIEHSIRYSVYTFMLIPEAVPLHFPNLSKVSFSWMYDFGNIAAFIPFGVIIPLLYRISFRKFICFFVIIISVLETIQSLTFLGTFDVNDIISNTLGAAIGFCAYRFGFAINISWKGLLASGITIAILLFAVMGISEIINYTLVKREGPMHSLNEVKEQTGKLPLTKDIPHFIVAGERIKPTLNLYRSDHEKTQTYTYILGDKKDVILYYSFGISDTGDAKGELTIQADGNTIFQSNEQYTNNLETEYVPFEKVNEITIIIKGNAKLWDVKFSEMKHWWE